MVDSHLAPPTTHEAPLDASQPPAWFAEAVQRLDAITLAFCENDALQNKNQDDLFLTLKFENDCACNKDPENARRITLRQLLQASGARLATGDPTIAYRSLHRLIENAAFEQEALRMLDNLHREAGSYPFTKRLFLLLTSAVRPYLSEEASDAVRWMERRVNVLPNLRTSHALQFDKIVRQAGDPPNEAAFQQALDILEAIAEHFMGCQDFLDKTASDLANELAYQNGWSAMEAQQRNQAFTETTLAELLALSRRRLLALNECGGRHSFYRGMMSHLHTLIEQALAEEQQRESAFSPTLKTASTRLSAELTSGK